MITNQHEIFSLDYKESRKHLSLSLMAEHSSVPVCFSTSGQCDNNVIMSKTDSVRSLQSSKAKDLKTTLLVLLETVAHLFWKRNLDERITYSKGWKESQTQP